MAHTNNNFNDASVKDAAVNKAFLDGFDAAISTLVAYDKASNGGGMLLVREDAYTDEGRQLPRQDRERAFEASQAIHSTLKGIDVSEWAEWHLRTPFDAPTNAERLQLCLTAAREIVVQYGVARSVGHEVSDFFLYRAAGEMDRVIDSGSSPSDAPRASM